MARPISEDFQIIASRGEKLDFHITHLALAPASSKKQRGIFLDFAQLAARPADEDKTGDPIGSSVEDLQTVIVARCVEQRLILEFLEEFDERVSHLSVLPIRQILIQAQNTVRYAPPESSAVGATRL